MTTDDIIDIIDQGERRAISRIESLMTQLWAANENEWKLGGERAAYASFQLRKDVAWAWKEELRKLGDRVRSTYTHDHPLYWRFNNIVMLKLGDVQDKMLRDFFITMMNFPGYVRAH